MLTSLTAMPDQNMRLLRLKSRVKYGLVYVFCRLRPKKMSDDYDDTKCIACPHKVRSLERRRLLNMCIVA